MTDSYYILEDGDQKGPYSLDELIDLQPDIHTRVLSPNEDTWVDACDVPELNPYFESFGVYFPTGDNLASFWWRALAFIIDFVIFSFIFSFIMALFASYGIIPVIKSMEQMLKLPYGDLVKIQVIVYGTFIIYNSAGEASPLKGSIGKKVCRLVVVDADGLSLTVLNSLIRSLGKAFSMFFWGIGFLSVFFTEHKQALHDLVARSYVIKRD